MHTGNSFPPLRFFYKLSFSARLILAISVFYLISVSAFGFSRALFKPYTLDEVEEARMAQKINEIGPATFHSASIGGGGEDLSHPLLYSYVNAIFYKLFGPQEPSLRGHGLMWFFLSLLLLFLLTAEIFKRDPCLYLPALLIVGSLYVVNPLLLQHSLILNNSDNNISTFAIILFVYLFLRFEGKEGRGFIRTRLILALVVALNYMCKELTPNFLILSLVCYRVLNRQFRKLLTEIFLTIGLGIAVFWAVWSLYCLFTGTDILAFIKFTALSKGKKVTLGFILRQFGFLPVILKWPLYWSSAPFFILVIAVFFQRLRSFLRLRSCSGVDFLLMASFIMFVPYVFVKPSIDMMKYQYPAYPFFIVLIAWFVLKVILDPLREKGLLTSRFFGLIPAGEMLVYVFGICAALGSWWYYKLGDYILILWGRLPARFLLSYYLPLIIGTVIFTLFFRRFGFYRAACCFLFFSVYPVNSGLDFVQTAGYTTAESWLNYGERGQMEAVEYLRRRMDVRMRQYLRKDIEYYLRYRYKIKFNASDPTQIFRTPDERALNAIFQSRDIQYFVFERTSSVQRANPDILNILSRYFIVEKQCGDFVILRHKASLLR